MNVRDCLKPECRKDRLKSREVRRETELPLPSEIPAEPLLMMLQLQAKEMNAKMMNQYNENKNLKSRLPNGRHKKIKGDTA
jgi:hypothetical protein